jgi:hypothetical protein
MPSLLFQGDQAFWVSNATKDLLYEAALAVARHSHPAAHERLSRDGRLVGCYEVSGVGFDLAAFAEAFGSTRAWQEATARDFRVVEALCLSPDVVRLMTKVFAWAWFLLDGGRCNNARGRHPDIHELPDVPEASVASIAVESPDPALEVGWLYRTPSTRFKFAFGIGLGALVGAVVAVGTLLLGQAQNWRVIPAWVFGGALLGSAHPTVDLIWSALNRLPKRPAEATFQISEIRRQIPGD